MKSESRKTSDMNKPVNILFLCTGNSCRSQMAEGFMREMGKGSVEVRSAGIEAHGKDPKAIAIMQEVGVDISGQESTVLTGDMLVWADLVVTLCGHADENCPALPPGTRKIHWPLEDPRKATGTEEEIALVYLTVRNEIRGLITEQLTTSSRK